MHTIALKYSLIFLILTSGPSWGQKLKSSKEKELLYSLVLENLNQYSNIPYPSKFQVSESIFGSLRNYLITKGDEDNGADTLARLVDSPKWAYIKTLNMNNMTPWSQSIVTRKDYLRNKKISITENKSESVFFSPILFSGNDSTAFFIYHQTQNNHIVTRLFCFLENVKGVWKISSIATPYIE